MNTAKRGTGAGAIAPPGLEQAERLQLTFECVTQPGGDAPVVDLAAAADGNWIAASFGEADRDAVVFSPRSELLRTLPGTPQAHRTASPSGRWLATFDSVQ